MSDRNVRRGRPDAVRMRLWDEDPAIGEILERSETVEETRGDLVGYLEDLEEAVRVGAFDLNRIEWRSALQAIEAFKSILSPESEAIAGFSTLETLRRFARGADEDVAPGFVDEFVHLFRAIHGRSEIGRGWFVHRHSEAAASLERLPKSGRRAGIERSHFLDRLAEEVEKQIARHPSGLDREVIEQRRVQRERVLAALGGTLRDWDDPCWQADHVLKGKPGAAMLCRLVPLTGDEIAAVHLAVRHEIPWGITPYYLSLFDWRSADRRVDGQVRAQVIPPIHTVRAMVEHRADRREAFDFMREHDTSPRERITRRYPMIAILKVSDTCPQICTYCQRNWEITDAMAIERIPDRAALDPTLDWFAEHPTIRDVLITGGDPLLLSDDLLAYILERFSRMDHVRHVRIGSRIPVTMPMRITQDLVDMLGRFCEPGIRMVSVVTHVESAYEVTPDLASAVGRLRRAGLMVYNQLVFTVDASRRFQTAATRVALKRAGIDPYYTFYTKGKDEHRDYLVPIARILQERKEEARLLPGIFRTDEPVFNVPRLGKVHLRAAQDRELIGLRGDGRRVYLFHPWEKGIAPVAPWPYVDVSIGEYLERLADRGENPDDYRSIWYYY